MPARRTTAKTLGQARHLRQNMTEAETRLWSFLRTLRTDGVHFRRQHAIGRYVTDFCAPRQHLIVELDGSQHVNHQERDNIRSGYLRKRGYRVIRFGNDAVIQNAEGVVRAILEALHIK